MTSHPTLVSDPLLPLVREVVADLLKVGNTVTPLDLLLRLEIIEAEQVEAWRKGGLPYLERGIHSGLARVARLLRLLREHALSLGLEPAPGKYVRRGHRSRLRFSKRADPASEAAYATHFVRRDAKPSPQT